MGKLSRFVIAAVCGVSLLVCLGANLAWAANPVYVDDNYNSGTPGWGVDHFATIQGGVTAVDAGGTVYVAEGYYEENDAAWRDLYIGKSLHLDGAGSASVVVGLSAGKTNGVEIYGSGLDVTIEGMTFTKRTGNTSASGFNIRVGEVASTFNSLVFRDVESAYATGRNVFIDGNGTYTSITVEDCSFHHSGAWGFSVRGVVAALNITNSDFDDNGTSDAAHGIGFDIDMPITVSGITVQGGSFSRNKAKGINLVKTTNATFTEITANSNGGAPGGGFGVSLWEWVSASSALTFERCTFDGNSTDGFLFGTEGTTTISNVAIHECFIRNNGRYGVLFYHNFGGSVSNVSITGCNLAGNVNRSVGTSAVPTVIDASGNWWGVATPAGVTGEVGANVDYTPWLDQDDDTGPGPGFQGDFSGLHVDDNSPQVGDVGRVQEGVDLATGTTVYLEAGTYEEQVEIAKTLTLDGGGGGAGGCIIKSPVTLTKSFTTGSVNKPVVYIHDATGVVVKNLTVDGAGRGNSNHRFIGIAYNNAGGRVESCTIKNIEDTPFSSYESVSLYAYNNDSVGRSLTVWDNTMFGFQKNAMALNAGDTTPLTVDVRRNTVTGAGAIPSIAQNGIQVWADMGSGVVADNIISGIGYSGSGWVATSILNYYADLNVTGNTISNAHMGIYNIDGAGQLNNNTLSIQKMGGYAWGIAASDPPAAKPSPFDEPVSQGGSGPSMVSMSPAATLNLTVSGNTVVFSGPDNTGTYGIEADAGYGPNDLSVTANHNTVTGFEVGMEFYKCMSSCYSGVFTSIVANYNNVAGNTLFGMRSNVDELMADGRHSWWGNATGPTHPTNPLGTGVPVSDYIDFGLWMTALNQISVVPSYGITKCGTPITYTFHIDRAGTAQARGYDVKFDVNDLIVTVADLTLPLPMDIVELPYLSAVGGTSFFVTVNGGGTYTVSCAILGGSVGATGNGDLFTVAFTPVTPGVEGTSPVSMVNLKLRDLNNQPLDVSGVGGSVQVDCTAPTMEAITEPQNKCYNTAPTFANFGFDDDVNLDLAEYNIDSGSWGTIFTGINAAFWDSDGWVLPDFASLSDASHTVYFRVKDDAGNYNGEGSPQPNLYSWSFVKDTVAPAAPTNFVALPGHNKVHLTWTNPTADFVGVEIRRVAWGDYPQYNTPGVPDPGYPADHNGGTPVTQTALQAYDDSPLTPRDIYNYAAFSYDCAGNYSALDDGAKDRSTSYWLGDMAPPAAWDGIINAQDVGAFSWTFGQVQVYPTPPLAPGTWNPEGDFGPTDDWSRFGIPLPDDVVDFEDLMILAMNYQKVGPLGTSGLPLLASTEKPLRDLVSFKLVPVSREGDHVTYALVIENGAKVLKGFALGLSYGVGNELVEVKASAGLSGKGSEHFFGTIEREMGKVEVCVAALGVDVPFEYTGEVARVVVREEGSNPAKVEKVVLRDVTNRGDEVVVAESHETPFIPAVSALMQNHPNPFNPVTQITYDVAVAGAVTIEIYDVSGHRVRTLVSGPADAGRHVIEWNGKDENGSTVHTGVYFYRMSAPGYVSPAKKMLLLK